MTMNFPKNTEMEAELTFVAQRRRPARWRWRRQGGGGGFFEGVGSVAATAKRRACACTIRSSSCRTAIYKPRAFDPRAGYFGD